MISNSVNVSNPFVESRVLVEDVRDLAVLDNIKPLYPAIESQSQTLQSQTNSEDWNKKLVGYPPEISQHPDVLVMIR